MKKEKQTQKQIVDSFKNDHINQFADEVILIRPSYDEEGNYCGDIQEKLSLKELLK